jgi:hypothetical protein
MHGIPSDCDFLLDANGFYRLSGNYWQQTALLAVHRRLVAAPLAVAEIAALPIACPDFNKRKAAMQTLYTVCGRILPEFPDVLTARAFGCTPPTGYFPEEASSVIQAVLKATSYEHLKNGVSLAAGSRILCSVSAADIRRRKKEKDAQWGDAASKASAHFRGIYSDGADRIADELAPLTSKEIYRVLKATAFKGGPLTNAALVILAAQAGLITVADNDAAAESKCAGRSLWLKVLSAYDGTLNAYVAAYDAYMTGLLEGRTPKRNDYVDLQYFLYLDAYATPLCLVTDDEGLARVGRAVLPDRVISLSDLLQALTLRHESR